MEKEIKRTKNEINDVLDKCMDAEENGSNFSGMSYEQGIRAGIDWITGDTDDHPIDE